MGPPVWGCAVALAGCWGNTTTVFPPGLEPLEDNTAPAPTGSADDPYPERLAVVSGKAAEWNWSHERGYVHAGLDRAWPVVRAPEVTRDPTIAEWSVDWGVEDFPVSYVIHYTVHDVLTVRFDITWRFAVIEGTDAAPTLIAGRFQKTWGTTFIRRQEGSVLARAVAGVPDLTEIELIERLDATNTGIGDIESYLSDYFRQILGGVHGVPG